MDASSDEIKTRVTGLELHLWHVRGTRAGFRLPLTAAHAQFFSQAITFPPFIASLPADMDPKVGHKRSISVANAASSASAAATSVEGAGQAAYVPADAAEQSRLKSDLDQLTRELEIMRGELEDMCAALYGTRPRDETSPRFVFYRNLAGRNEDKLIDLVMKKEEAIMKREDEIRALRIATLQRETVQPTFKLDLRFRRCCRRRQVGFGPGG